MDFKPQYMLDMLKTTRVLSRTTWLALSRGGEQSSIPCECLEANEEYDEVIVRAVVGEREYVLRVPGDAVTPIPSTPTLSGKPTNGGCQGDGHYLCRECGLFDDRTDHE